MSSEKSLSSEGMIVRPEVKNCFSIVRSQGELLTSFPSVRENKERIDAPILLFASTGEREREKRLLRRLVEVDIDHSSDFSLQVK